MAYSALRDEIERDFDAGVVMQPERVLASGDVSVLEGRFINPPHDPFHCPPGLALVMQHRAGRVSRLHLYLSPRPPSCPAARRPLGRIASGWPPNF